MNIVVAHLERSNTKNLMSKLDQLTVKSITTPVVLPGHK